VRALLRVHGLVVRFGAVTALDGADLELAPGEIHALLGENGAGKTTLVNVLAGIQAPLAGGVELAGKPVTPAFPGTARRLGIGVVHQHFSLVPSLSAVDNLALAQPELGGRRLQRRLYRSRLDALAERVGLRAPGSVPVGRLSVGDRQRLEILLALSADPRVLVLDEPTASLTPQETGELLELMRKLRGQGTGVLFITHKLEEALSAADRVSVFRAGKREAMLEAASVNSQQLARLMVGDLPESRWGAESPMIDTQPVLLSARGLSVRADAAEHGLQQVSLDVRGGEIVGVAGVDGNGQTELAETLAGLRPYRGTVTLAGRELRGHTAHRATTLGLAHIPGDRRQRGLVMGLSIADNLLLRHLERRSLRCGPFFRRDKAATFVAGCLRDYAIRASSPAQLAGTLSGGNQQRLLVAREMELAPRILLAVNPSRGLDVAATREVHARLRAAAQSGMAVLLVSTDLEEILALSRQVAVLYRGRLSFVPPRQRSTRAIGLLMGGVTPAA
jgi:simple sugar transport system ATP-binding protein